MDIKDLIPVGSKNAISRKALEDITCNSDRKNRDEISRLNSEIVIINNGNGYFIPDKDDLPQLRHYIVSNEMKAKSILLRIKLAKALLADYEAGRKQ